MKRSILSLFLAGIIMSGILGYGSLAGAENEPVKFTLWHSFVGADMRAPFMDQILKMFNDAYPDIKIVEEQIPRDQYQTKLKTLAASGPTSGCICPVAQCHDPGICQSQSDCGHK